MDSTITTTVDTTSTFEGYTPTFYMPRLSDDELVSVERWATHSLTATPAAKLLSSYLFAMVRFERERRDAVANGDTIIEAAMTQLPAHCWSDVELAATLQRLTAISFSTDGEVRELFQHLTNVVVAETTYRLGLRNEPK